MSTRGGGRRMTRTASRVLPIPCPLRILPLVIQNLRLRATLRPHRWPPLRLWQLLNRRHHFPHRTSPNARHQPTPNHRPRVKHPTYSGHSLRRHQRLRSPISDRTPTSERGVHPIPRQLRKEAFNTSLCTNRLARMGPVVFNGRSFVGSPVRL